MKLSDFSNATPNANDFVATKQPDTICEICLKDVPVADILLDGIPSKSCLNCIVVLRANNREVKRDE